MIIRIREYQPGKYELKSNHIRVGNYMADKSDLFIVMFGIATIVNTKIGEECLFQIED